MCLVNLAEILPFRDVCLDLKKKIAGVGKELASLPASFANLSNGPGKVRRGILESFNCLTFLREWVRSVAPFSGLPCFYSY